MPGGCSRASKDAEHYTISYFCCLVFGITAQNMELIFIGTLFGVSVRAGKKNLKLSSSLCAAVRERRVSDSLIGLTVLPNFQDCVWLHIPPPDWFCGNSDARPAPV
jgi:hypothetical protein